VAGAPARPNPPPPPPPPFGAPAGLDWRSTSPADDCSWHASHHGSLLFGCACTWHPGGGRRLAAAAQGESQQHLQRLQQPQQQAAAGGEGQAPLGGGRQGERSGSGVPPNGVCFYSVELATGRTQWFR
jgi:hypothetical protein